MKKQIAAVLSRVMMLTQAGASNNSIEAYKKYRAAVDATATMSMNQEIRQILEKHGLDILNFTWEDTGRTQGSALGPNISDMSIQAHVVGQDGKIEPVLMPVIRYPNFADKTADLSPNEFYVLVGNEKGGLLKKVSLTEYLGNFRSYLSNEKAWTAKTNSLLAPRDTHVLVSAQVSYLPVPAGQKASFNPVLFNYQSSENNAAVLTILATREGTSATVINNKRDGFEAGHSHGQRLFFNENGQRASLTGERKADFDEESKRALRRERPDNSVTANAQSGLNMVLLIQVPLKHKPRPLGFGGCGANGICLEMARSLSDGRGVDDAVIGHGELEGPFTEIDTTNTLGEEQQVIERDERFPIRVTVQFYRATSDANLTQEDAKAIRSQIDLVYKNADYVGSLVTEGDTGRPTGHEVKCKTQWWPRYWLTRQDSEREAVELLHRHYGPYYWTFFCETEEKFKSALDYLAGLKK